MKKFLFITPLFLIPIFFLLLFGSAGLESTGTSSNISLDFDEATFRKVISEKGNAFSGKADKIILESQKAGVHPVLFGAIMIHESAWGTSQAIREHNNPSGQMSSSGVIHFDTLDQGIEATGATLKNLVVERQLTTVEKLGSVYCPVGADNDPTGLNIHWVPTIKDMMKMLGGNENMMLWGENGDQSSDVDSKDWKNPVRSSYTITQEWDIVGFGTDVIHGGIDVASIPVGSMPPIFSACSGIVEDVGFASSVSGNYVIVRHSEGMFSYYGHLSKVNVSVGQSVNTETEIGSMGETGLAFGVHLHFEIWKDELWKRVNPRNYVQF